MKISRQDKKLLISAFSVGFIIFVGKVCGLSEEILEKIIKGFLGFEIIANIDFSKIKTAKKTATYLKFFTKTN